MAITGHICFATEKAGFQIILQQTGIDQFRVTYGKQDKMGLNYAQAAAELGACIMHAAACEGNLDNRTRKEARKDGDSKPYFSAA